MNLKEKAIQLVVQDRLSDLFEEAEVAFREETIINIQQDIDNVFHGCETWDDAIQRIKELASVIEF